MESGGHSHGSGCSCAGFELTDKGTHCLTRRRPVRSHRGRQGQVLERAGNRQLPESLQAGRGPGSVRACAAPRRRRPRAAARDPVLGRSQSESDRAGLRRGQAGRRRTVRRSDPDGPTKKTTISASSKRRSRSTPSNSKSGPPATAYRSRRSRPGSPES